MEEAARIRSRIVAWKSPEEFVWRRGASDAISHLTRMRAGEIPKPPLYELLRIEVMEASSGRVSLTIDPDDSFASPIGLVGGGIIMTILDTTLAWTCDTLAPPGMSCVTLEMKTNFLRPVRTDAPRLACQGECVFSGARIIVAKARLIDGSGAEHAIATGTFLMTPRD